MRLEFWILLGWLIVLIWVPIVIVTNRKVHPKVLFWLFMVELWAAGAPALAGACVTTPLSGEFFSPPPRHPSPRLSFGGDYLYHQQWLLRTRACLFSETFAQNGTP